MADGHKIWIPIGVKYMQNGWPLPINKAAGKTPDETSFQIWQQKFYVILQFMTFIGVTEITKEFKWPLEPMVLTTPAKIYREKKSSSISLIFSLK